MTETIHETWDDARVIADLLFAATTGANRLQQTAAIDEAVRFIRALMAQRTRQEERVRVLEEALRDANCPRPCNGRPDGFTVGECTDALECGCNLGASFRAALGNGGGDA